MKDLKDKGLFISLNDDEDLCRSLLSVLYSKLKESNEWAVLNREEDQYGLCGFWAYYKPQHNIDGLESYFSLGVMEHALNRYLYLDNPSTNTLPDDEGVGGVPRPYRNVSDFIDLDDINYPFGRISVGLAHQIASIYMYGEVVTNSGKSLTFGDYIFSNFCHHVLVSEMFYTETGPGYIIVDGEKFTQSKVLNMMDEWSFNNHSDSLDRYCSKAIRNRDLKNLIIPPSFTLKALFQYLDGSDIRYNSLKYNTRFHDVDPGHLLSGLLQSSNPKGMVVTSKLQSSPVHHDVNLGVLVSDPEVFYSAHLNAKTLSHEYSKFHMDTVEEKFIEWLMGGEVESRHTRHVDTFRAAVKFFGLEYMCCSITPNIFDQFRKFGDVIMEISDYHQDSATMKDIVKTTLSKFLSGSYSIEDYGTELYVCNNYNGQVAILNEGSAIDLFYDLFNLEGSPLLGKELDFQQYFSELSSNPEDWYKTAAAFIFQNYPALLSFALSFRCFGGLHFYPIEVCGSNMVDCSLDAFNHHPTNPTIDKDTDYLYYKDSEIKFSSLAFEGLVESWAENYISSEDAEDPIEIHISETLASGMVSFYTPYTILDSILYGFTGLVGNDIEGLDNLNTWGALDTSTFLDWVVAQIYDMPGCEVIAAVPGHSYMVSLFDESPYPTYALLERDTLPSMFVGWLSNFKVMNNHSEKWLYEAVKKYGLESLYRGVPDFIFKRFLSSYPEPEILLYS